LPDDSYPLLYWVIDKRAQSSSVGHLDFGVMIQTPSSNGLPTS
jgi:hypothetical protein